MQVGDHVQRRAGLSKRGGEPLSPRTKVGYLTATRTFFRDVQEWGLWKSCSGGALTFVLQTSARLTCSPCRPPPSGGGGWRWIWLCGLRSPLSLVPAGPCTAGEQVPLGAHDVDAAGLGVLERGLGEFRK